MRQAFLKWLQKSSEADRAKAPAIVKALEQLEKKQTGLKANDKQPDKRPTRGSKVQPQHARQRVAEAHPVAKRAHAARQAEGYPGPGKSAGRNRRPKSGGTSGATGKPTKKWRDVPVIEPEPERPPEPVVLPEGSSPAESTIDAHVGSLPARMHLVSGPTSLSGMIRRARTIIRVQVGLDFGTASTKVMYQQLGTAERKVRPVLFAHRLRDYASFCLPSLATFDRSGNLFLGDLAAERLSGQPWVSGLSRFKMLVAGQQDEHYLDRACRDRFREHTHEALGDDARCPPEALTATYLAYVMRKVRRYLEHEFGTTDLELWFNTSVPVDQTQKSPVMAAFERVFGIAEMLERDRDGTVTARAWLERAVDWWESGLEPARQSADTRVFVIPEAVAEVAAYLSSLQRESGLHALVDIGAGTTDVSIFNIHLGRKSGTRSVWYAARSIPMGAGHIETWVATTLERTREPAIVTRELIFRALSGDPDLGAECGPVIHDVLKTIWHRTNKAWGVAYGHRPHESCWKGNAVRVFLAGGGGLIPSAREVFSQSWQRGWGPYPCTVLPQPEGYDRMGPDVPFARLCVAYGLAIPVPELGTYVMPTEAPTEIPRPSPHSMVETYPRQEVNQLLPRYGWT